MMAGGRGWCRSAGVLVAVLVVMAGAALAANLPPPCDSEIYCHGVLLKTVQMARLHNDSKYFVDMTLKFPPSQVLTAFEGLMNNTSNKPTQAQVKTFVEENFHDPGTEFEDWVPTDWSSSPDFLKKIEDPELEDWAGALNDLWKKLGRKVSEEVQREQERFSQIYVSNPVIVPGGRFREFYYWDSYWTIDGLLLSGMKETVKGMLQNFLDMVVSYGMVPNGGRIYYTRRSQPPYLIPMVKLYMDYTNDHDFLRKNIKVIEEEFKFWEENRSLTIKDREGKPHKVAQYRVNAGDPRPESFREDYELAHQLATEEDQQQLYVQLKSGAESGWDYSTRWFVSNNTNKVAVYILALFLMCRWLMQAKSSFLVVLVVVVMIYKLEVAPNRNLRNLGTLKDLKVTSIVPVDLNSLLCMNARILSQFYNKLGNYTMKKHYEDVADQKNETMAKIFWDKTDGTWYDYDAESEGKRRYFYLSNIHPIWSGCFGQEDSRAHTIENVINYLKKIGVLEYKSGVPTSLEKSGQQWDFPNAWAPLQHLIIMGLYEARSIHHEADSLSFKLAEKWIRTNWEAYQQSNPNAMFEKYNVTVVGLPGGGGEYDTQLGFGWTNGVALRLLNTYGDRLTAVTGGSGAPKATSLGVMLLVGLVPLWIQSLTVGSP